MAAATKSDVDTSASTDSRRPLEREILNLEKKLRDIKKLRARLDAGEILEPLQKAKLDKESELELRIEELEAQQANEAASVSVPDTKCEAAMASETPDASAEASGTGSLERIRFDASCFEGDWLETDSSNTIQVTRGRTRRGRAGTWITYTYQARICRDGVFSRKLTIGWDTDAEEWRCGNATLKRSDSDSNAITWCSAAGRVSKWSRAPPNGPIYFDAPADTSESMLQQEWQDAAWLQWGQDPNNYEQTQWEWSPDGYHYDDGWPSYLEPEGASPDLVTQVEEAQHTTG